MVLLLDLLLCSPRKPGTGSAWAWGSAVIPQKCSWHPCNGRKWRGTKKPLDEGERESKKAGLKLNIQKTKVMASCPITSWQTEGAKVEAVTDFTFLGSKITADGDLSQEIKMLAPWKKSFDKPRQSIKKQRHHFIDKGPYSQSYGFSSSHVWMWEFDHKEGWELKN